MDSAQLRKRNVNGIGSILFYRSVLLLKYLCCKDYLICLGIEVIVVVNS